MNQKYQIVSDGACDLSKEQIEKNNLIVLPFYVSFDNKNYKKVGVEIGVREFYQQMVDNPNVFPKTSMPSSQDFYNVFEPLVKKNIPIICICITSHFSGSFNAANVAKEQILESYPNAKITVIDSYTITVIQGLLVLEICRMQQNGLSYEEVVNNIYKIIPSVRILFSVDNLDYLKHGGRIGKITYIIGSALKIKPIIVFKDGEISAPDKALGLKRAIKRIVENLKKHFSENGEKISDYMFGIGYGYNVEDGDMLKKQFEEVPLPKENTYVFQIGSTIAAHTGPYTVGIGFIKKYDAIH